jgi:hypothetical protein
MRSPKELLAAYVEAHNAGFRSGDFEPVNELLHATASMRFYGIEMGPFDSAEAILQGFRVQPPEDELVVQSIRAIGNKTAEATYAWESAPGKLAGRLHVVALRGRISAIRIEVFS